MYLIYSTLDSSFRTDIGITPDEIIAEVILIYQEL